jgi:hypothetical protein
MRSIILAISLGALCAAQSVDQLRQSFDQHCGLAANTRDEQLAKLTKSYQAALERVLDKIKTAGDLDAALPIHQELVAIKQVPGDLPPLPDTAPADLKSLRTTYQDSRFQILKTHATTLDGLADKMEAALKSRESELTKAGKIADAVAARVTREDLEKDADIRAARDLLKLGGVGGKGKPALQLRRYGDNLEVLVFYDRRGKISMDSEVENVREKTGDGRELGDTQAKVLGEFVGAKGYDVDPYVSFHHVFNTKDPGKMAVNQMASQYGFAIEETKGVRLAYEKTSKYPYCHLGNVIPPETYNGTYRFSASYFIPSSNRHVSGFQLIQGEGGGPPVGGVRFETRGKWTNAAATSESVNASPNLVLVLIKPSSVKFADATEDFVVLAEVKIEHLKFTAFVQQRIGDSGQPENEQRDPQTQPVFITNGEFAAQK